ncbi:MAG: gluconokinase [Opitutaceae bacterium]|jgi:gluconokinase
MNIILIGVAGSGKTTIGEKLAARLGGNWRFYDADHFHPPANIAKMSRGVPLDDADRAPWLDALRAHLGASAARGEHVILACSALKETYRHKLADTPGPTRFVYLKGGFETLRGRLRTRRGHYLKAAMLHSQFEALEEPAPEAAFVMDATLAPDDIIARILREIRLPGPRGDSSPQPA